MYISINFISNKEIDISRYKFLDINIDIYIYISFENINL